MFVMHEFLDEALVGLRTTVRKLVLSCVCVRVRVGVHERISVLRQGLAM